MIIFVIVLFFSYILNQHIHSWQRSKGRFYVTDVKCWNLRNPGILVKWRGIWLIMDFRLVSLCRPASEITMGSRQMQDTRTWWGRVSCGQHVPCQKQPTHPQARVTQAGILASFARPSGFFKRSQNSVFVFVLM
jgi:hypothetical protein